MEWRVPLCIDILRAESLDCEMVDLKVHPEIRDSVEPADLGYGPGLSGKQGGRTLAVCKDTCPRAGNRSRNAGKLNKFLHKTSTSFIRSLIQVFWTALCLIGRIKSGEQGKKCRSLSLGLVLLHIIE